VNVVTGGTLPRKTGGMNGSFDVDLDDDELDDDELDDDELDDDELDDDELDVVQP
jgi:hypothetical protein